MPNLLLCEISCWNLVTSLIGSALYIHIVYFFEKVELSNFKQLYRGFIDGHYLGSILFFFLEKRGDS